MYLIVFFLIFAFGVPVVSAENPITLAEIDSKHEKSQLQTEYQEIASQIEKVLASNPNQYPWQWRQARTQYSLAKKRANQKVTITTYAFSIVLGLLICSLILPSAIFIEDCVAASRGK